MEGTLQAGKSSQWPGSNIRGVSLVDASDAIYAWLKFGPTVTMAEGRTQDYIAQAVNSNAAAPVRVPAVFLSFEWDRWGFIVMEFIDGEMCDDQDVRCRRRVAVSCGHRGPNLPPFLR